MDYQFRRFWQLNIFYYFRHPEINYWTIKNRELEFRELEKLIIPSHNL